MSFKPLIKNTRPVRRWGVLGGAGSGKSSFLTQAIGPILLLDIDHRFSDVAHLTKSEIVVLSDEIADLHDVRSIDKLIADNVRNSGIKSTILDSVTPLIQRVIRRNALKDAAGEGPKHKGAIHREKADTMALLIDAVFSSAPDVYFVWHTGYSMLGDVQKRTETLPEIEQARLRRQLNAEIEIIVDEKEPNRRGVKVHYCRNNPAAQGQVLWDTPENLSAGTFWKGMMERLDVLFTPPAIAPSPKPAGLPATPAAELPPPSGAPAARSFRSVDEAIAWGAEELQLRPEEVRDIYDDQKKRHNPATASAMWALWVTTIAERKEALSGAKF